MTIRAVLFDLYDTLLYAQPTGTREKALEVVTDAGIPQEDWLRGWRTTPPAAMRGTIPTMMERVDLALAEAGVNSPPAALIEEVAQFLLTRKNTYLQGDTIGGLKELRERGYRLAAVGNVTPEEREAIRGLDIASLFDAFVLSCEVGYIKPEPEIYQLAAQRLDVSPEECVFVGDGMSQELSGAKAVGMTAVQIVREKRDEDDPRDKIFDFSVRDLAELLAWLPAQVGGMI